MLLSIFLKNKILEVIVYELLTAICGYKFNSS